MAREGFMVLGVGAYPYFSGFMWLKVSSSGNVSWTDLREKASVFTCDEAAKEAGEKAREEIVKRLNLNYPPYAPFVVSVDEANGKSPHEIAADLYQKQVESLKS